MKFKEIDLFYVKDVPNWERALRLVLGLMALCPLCAMVGRKLDRGG